MAGLKQGVKKSMVKPSDKEISGFRKYLKKQGFTVDGLCKNSYYLYMSYGYLCVLIEYTKKGEFKDVSAFLTIGWQSTMFSCFPNYYDFGRVRKLARDYVEKCILTSTSVMVNIRDMFVKIDSLTKPLKKGLTR